MMPPKLQLPCVHERRVDERSISILNTMSTFEANNGTNPRCNLTETIPVLMRAGFVRYLVLLLGTALLHSVLCLSEAIVRNSVRLTEEPNRQV